MFLFMFSTRWHNVLCIGIGNILEIDFRLVQNDVFRVNLRPNKTHVGLLNAFLKMSRLINLLIGQK